MASCPVTCQGPLVAALFALKATTDLNVNVQFVIEGEEESNGEGLREAVTAT